MMSDVKNHSSFILFFKYKGDFMPNNFKMFFIASMLFTTVIQADEESLTEQIYFCFEEYCNPKKHVEMIPAKNNTIKNVIFDLNGVVVNTAKKSFFKAIPHLFKYGLLRIWRRESLSLKKFFDQAIKDIPATFPTSPDKVAYHDNKPILPILNDWQCGVDVYPIILKHIENKNLPKSDKKLLRLISGMLFDGKQFATSKFVILHTEQILRDLKDAGYKIYVLSNWDAQSFPLFKEINSELVELFDGIMISGDEQLVKPNVRFYKKCLKKFRLKAKESLFVDDQSINVEGARKAGMHAFQFKHNDKKNILSHFQEHGIAQKEIIA